MFLKRRPAIFIFSVLLFSGCASTGKPTTGAKPDPKMPDWVLHYKAEDKICGVGISLPHIRGIAHQRILAISRGIDEIAKQLNVTVDTNLESLMTGSSNGVSSSLSTFSVQTTNGQTVNAEIIEAWINDRTKEFYVLICMDK
ncbi:MAG: hypothetical protein RQ824_08475 [bacterium]|nr:hypothetical protein [bacterium]